MTRRSRSTGQFVKSGAAPKRRKRKRACKKTPCRTASGAFGREVCYPGTPKARRKRRRKSTTGRARTRSGRFK